MIYPLQIHWSLRDSKGELGIRISIGMAVGPNALPSWKRSSSRLFSRWFDFDEKEDDLHSRRDG
jgi:hypothetical protein